MKLLNGWAYEDLKDAFEKQEPLQVKDWLELSDFPIPFSAKMGFVEYIVTNMVYLGNSGIIYNTLKLPVNLYIHLAQEVSYQMNHNNNYSNVGISHSHNALDLYHPHGCLRIFSL